MSAENDESSPSCQTCKSWRRSPSRSNEATAGTCLKVASASVVVGHDEAVVTNGGEFRTGAGFLCISYLKVGDFVR